MKRQIPNDFEEKIFIKNIDYIKSLFNDKWLNRNPTKNIFKQLWHRKDFLASCELYTIGLGVKKLQTNNYDNWLKDFYKQINKNNVASIYGIIYELFIYTLFQNKIELAEPNQAHYDFKILKEKQSIYTSIKKLTTSEQEKKLKQDFNILKKFYIKELKRNNLNGLSLYLQFNDYKNYTLDSAKKIIKKTILQKSDITNNDFFTTLKEIKCNENNFIIHNNKISYQFNLTIPFDGREQNRFINLFKKASNNLNKIDGCNLIIIGLSSTIDMQTAKKWLINEFNRDKYTRISGVLLTQYLPAQNLKENSTHLNLQSNFIYNINAKQKIDFTDEIFKIELPIGTISQKSSNYHIITDNGNLEITDHYMFQSGYKLCEHLFGKMEYNFSYVPHLTEEILLQNTKIEAIRPIGDKCVLL